MNQPRFRRRRPIVVPISDPDTHGLRSLPPAIDLAAAAGAPICLLHWVPPGGSISDAVRRLGDETARLLVELPVDIAFEAQRGGTLDEHVRELDPLVCVTASSGTIYEGDHLVGSATELLVRTIDAPLLAVGPSVPTGTGLAVDEIVAAVDPTDGEIEVLPAATGWAGLLGLPLVLARVYPDGTGPPDDDRNWRTATCDDRHGIAEALIGLTGERGLLALTPHARTGLERLALGSVAADVIAKARRPVLLVRSGDGQ